MSSAVGFAVLALIFSLVGGLSTKSLGGGLAGVGAAVLYFWWYDWGSFWNAAWHRRRAEIQVTSDGLAISNRDFGVREIAALEVRAPARPAQTAPIVMSQRDVIFVGDAQAVMIASAAHGLSSSIASTYGTGHAVGAAIGNAARTAQAARSYVLTVRTHSDSKAVVIAGGLTLDCAQALVGDLTNALRGAQRQKLGHAALADEQASGTPVERAVDAYTSPGFNDTRGALESTLSGSSKILVLSLGVFGIVLRPLYQFLIAPRWRSAKVAGVVVLGLVGVVLVLVGNGPAKREASEGNVTQFQGPKFDSSTPTQAQEPLPPKIIAARATTAPNPLPTQPVAPNHQKERPVEDLPPPGPASVKDTRATTYAVFDVERGDTLNVRSTPNAKSPIVFGLLPTAKAVLATGRTESVRDMTWTEITTSEGAGWVNRRFLIEEPHDGCSGAELNTLIGLVADAFQSRDARSLQLLVSPLRGLIVRRDVNTPSVRIQSTRVGAIFSSRAAQSWPGRQENVMGSFNDVVLPSLQNTLRSKPTMTCGEVALPTDSQHTTAWPPELGALLPFSITPAPTEGHLSTWVFGIEYVAGKPYVAVIVEYAPTDAAPPSPSPP